MLKADPSGPSRLREGVLIDFDFAIHVDKHKKTAAGERSGTIPFVAIDILSTLATNRTYICILKPYIYLFFLKKSPATIL